MKLRRLEIVIEPELIGHGGPDCIKMSVRVHTDAMAHQTIKHIVLSDFDSLFDLVFQDAKLDIKRLVQKEGLNHEAP